MQSDSEARVARMKGKQQPKQPRQPCPRCGKLMANPDSVGHRRTERKQAELAAKREQEAEWMRLDAFSAQRDQELARVERVMKRAPRHVPPIQSP